MRIYDVILKKRNSGTLTDEEISFFVKGYTSGEIPDYQASALLMAIWFNGMNAHETAVLTNRMADSGDRVDLSAIVGIKVDKHSTGGVGDKTTLIVAPIVAACGVPVAKMSGRGLGHTGGTIDKLESIPGFQVDVARDRFFEIVRECGLAVIGQTGNIAPADKKLYALRDVTATVDSLPLIASSVMSKKLAAGADAIVLDVKTGSGAFMKTLDDSIALAESMVSIGEHNGRRMAALITDMERPLGAAIGNALEVIEAVQTLQGSGPSDLTEVCLQLASNMLVLAGKGDLADCRLLAMEAIVSGKALDRLCAMTRAQGGDERVLRDTTLFRRATIMESIAAPCDGFITRMQTEECGVAAMLLGAGREKKEDTIDPAAGIVLVKKTGDAVRKGETIARMYAARSALITPARERFLASVEIGAQKPDAGKLVYARVTADGIEKF